MDIIRYLSWGVPGQASLEGPVVPADEVWKIQLCGIATDDGNPIEWMMQVRMPDPMLWLMPVYRNVGYTMGTPTLAVEREFLVLPGERIAARANGLRSDKKMCLLYSGFSFPFSDLESLVRGASQPNSISISGTYTLTPVQ
jgi:hypothetical protein